MQKIIYEYCIIRYVPDVERLEFINIGLMMMCKRFRWMRSEIVLDEPRIAALFPHTIIPESETITPDLTDPRTLTAISRLKTQSALFTRSDVPAPGLPVEERYRWLAAVKSAILQTSPSHPGLLLTDPSHVSLHIPSSGGSPSVPQSITPAESRSTPDSLTRADAIHLLDTKFTELLHRLIL